MLSSCASGGPATYTITGAFNQRSDAELALEALHQAGFTLDAGPASDAQPDTDSGALSTPNPEFEVSPEPAASAGAEDAPQTAATGVAVGGAPGFIVGLGALRRLPAQGARYDGYCPVLAARARTPRLHGPCRGARSPTPPCVS